MRRLALVTALVITVAFLAASCGGKPIVGTTVLYDSATATTRKAFQDDFDRWYENVRACMGITEPVPQPRLVIYDGNRVMCGEATRWGCHRSGTIILPKKTRTNIVRHEIVHYLLWKTAGDADASHRSDYFRLCSGVVVINE